MELVKTPVKEPRTLRLNPQDNVATAIDGMETGAVSSGVTATQRVPRGHKMALQKIDKGEPIRKFGQIIGFAKSDIKPGDWVHEHNVEMGEFSRDYAFAQDARKEDILPVEKQATFQGLHRANGKTGTRNYIGIMTSVNCSATVATFIAKEVERSGMLAMHVGQSIWIKLRAPEKAADAPAPEPKVKPDEDEAADEGTQAGGPPATS